MSLHNSIISNKVGPNDVEVFISAFYPDKINLEFGYSNIRGGLESISTPNDISLVWGVGNIDADPCFARVGRLFDNNTPANPNDDMWIDGDYHLKKFGRADGSQMNL